MQLKSFVKTSQESVKVFSDPDIHEKVDMHRIGGKNRHTEIK
jgi:hypothetical protein